MNAYDLPWIDPLALARSLDDSPLVLLHSGQQAGYSGAVSLLACNAADVVSGDDFEALTPRLSHDAGAMENAWFGYLGYGLKDALEVLPPDAPGPITLPKLWFARFSILYRFDHARRTLTCFSRSAPRLPEISPKIPLRVSVRNLSSNFTRERYQSAVQHVIDDVHAGKLYQANLTRKFWGEFKKKADSFALFEQLCEISPSPYSAYIRFGHTAILSSSPERFLMMDAEGRVTVRPIKGSAPRGRTPEEDARFRDSLTLSEKDRAENLMIVDLMRNDLARGCVPGSVNVSNLFELTTHPLVHHLSSTISGVKREEVSALQLVAGCFPPGSMTGAPKVGAMRLCTALERLERGVYSGALGWFGGDGSVDLSVVIRTLVVQENRFEFQVGGGVVADSTPEGEWREALVKARGLARLLGISENQLAEL